MGVEALETFRQFVEKNAEQKIYPPTYNALVYLHKYRARFGLTDAFARVAGRWLVNRGRFYELIGERKE